MVGHVTPEAFDGGPIALVKDGDIISIDAPHRTLSVVGLPTCTVLPHTCPAAGISSLSRI